MLKRKVRLKIKLASIQHFDKNQFNVIINFSTIRKRLTNLLQYLQSYLHPW